MSSPTYARSRRIPCRFRRWHSLQERRRVKARVIPRVTPRVTPRVIPRVTLTPRVMRREARTEAPRKARTEMLPRVMPREALREVPREATREATRAAPSKPCADRSEAWYPAETCWPNRRPGGNWGCDSTTYDVHSAVAGSAVGEGGCQALLLLISDVRFLPRV